jgi:hypothetical protein
MRRSLLIDELGGAIIAWILLLLLLVGGCASLPPAKPSPFPPPPRPAACHPGRMLTVFLIGLVLGAGFALATEPRPRSF